MQRYIFVSAIALILSVSSGLSQTFGQVQATGEFLESTDIEWMSLNNNATRDAVLEALEGAGLDLSVASQRLEADSYELYISPQGPGMVSYLAVPRSSQGAPVEFSSSGNGSTPIGLFWQRPTAEQIREEIIDGMQAAIDALCGMRARPSEIRAQASAFGVVEVEATWNAAEICGD